MPLRLDLQQLLAQLGDMLGWRWRIGPSFHVHTLQPASPAAAAVSRELLRAGRAWWSSDGSAVLSPESPHSGAGFP